MAHLVITIGCEYGAKGNMIGKRVAEDLGIKFYDRDTVDEIIKEVGIPKEIMEKVEEGGTIAGKGAEGDVRGSFSKYADLTQRAIHVQKTIIRKLADRESCVIIGRCANMILKDYSNVLRVFVYGDWDFRIREASKKLSGTTKDIEKFMQKDDKRKEDFCKRFMGVDWADMTKYNLCLDNGTLGYEKCVEEIESALEILKK